MSKIGWIKQVFRKMTRGNYVFEPPVYGYKIFNHDLTCRGFQYEIGKEYSMIQPIRPCLQGFHFCQNPIDCLNFYSFDANLRMAKVVALGEVQIFKDKCVTNKIKILEEIPLKEALGLAPNEPNIGAKNSGRNNIGDRNIGMDNIGISNYGVRNQGANNVGTKNIGYENRGEENIGYGNRGEENIGSFNEGKGNIGSFNEGKGNNGTLNQGMYNSGVENKGSLNTGRMNKGNNNFGSFNVTDGAFGAFNTAPQYITMFNKPTTMTMKEWLNHPTYRVIKKELSIKKLDPEQVVSPYITKQIRELPNFDQEIFEKTTGLKLNI